MIPDDRELLADLTGVEYGYALREGRDAIILEKKEDMKRRGLASPDLADALALTFAYPVAAQDHRWQSHRQASPSNTKYKSIPAGLVRAAVITTCLRSRRRLVSNSANTPRMSRKHLPAVALVSIGCSMAFWPHFVFSTRTMS